MDEKIKHQDIRNNVQDRIIEELRDMIILQAAKIESLSHPNPPSTNNDEDEQGGNDNDKTEEPIDVINTCETAQPDKNENITDTVNEIKEKTDETHHDKEMNLECIEIEDSQDDEDFEMRVDAGDGLNIIWTSSENENSANEIDLTSKPFQEQEKIVQSTRTVEKFLEVGCDKSSMKYPIVGWEYDGDKNIFIITRQRGHTQQMENTEKFKTLPRWDLNKLADLEIKNPSDSNVADAFQEKLRRFKSHGWKDYKKKKPRKIKIKRSNPTVKKKFKMTLHDPNLPTRVGLPGKRDECLQNAVSWLYCGGTGEAIISLSDGTKIRVGDPFYMNQFCEKDARKLASMTILHVEDKKKEAEQYLRALKENIDEYNRKNLADAMNAIESRKMRLHF